MGKNRTRRSSTVLCLVCHKNKATHSTDDCECQQLCKSCAAIIKLNNQICPACNGKVQTRNDSHAFIDEALINQCQHVFSIFATESTTNRNKLILQGRKPLLDCLHLLGLNPGKREFTSLCRDRQTFSFDFLCQAASQLPKLDTQAIMAAFKLIDKNGDGELSIDELKDTLTNFGEALSEDEVKHMVKMFDADESGAIDYNEFCGMLLSFMKQAEVQLSGLNPVSSEEDEDSDVFIADDNRDDANSNGRASANNSKANPIKKKSDQTGERKKSHRVIQKQKSWSDRPADLQDWDGDRLQGVFQASTGGRVLSEIYEVSLSEPSDVFISLRSRHSGRYRRPNPSMDFRAYITKKTKEKYGFPELLGASRLATNGESSIRIHLDAGEYQIVPFSSGCHLKKRSDNLTKHDVLIPDSDPAKFTNKADDMLKQIFARFDYDGSKQMSESEYNMYMNFVEGATLDEGLWESVIDYGAVGGDLSLEGFINMYKDLAEALDIDDLYANIESLGFNQALDPDELEGFTLYMFTKKQDISKLFVVPVDERLVQQMDLVDILQTGKSDMVQEGLYRFTRLDTDHASIAFQNLSSDSVNISVNLEACVNVMSNQPTMKPNLTVPAGGAAICCHLMPLRSIKAWRVECDVIVSK